MPRTSRLVDKVPNNLNVTDDRFEMDDFETRQGWHPLVVHTCTFKEEVSACQNTGPHLRGLFPFFVSMKE